jgi:hypothetical protein
MPGLLSSIVVKSQTFVTTIVLSVLLFVCIPTGIYAQNVYGLEFSGKKIAQELRTSLNLFPDEALTIKDDLDLSFDLSFAPGFDSYFGYIFRITNDQGQNTDLIYSNQTQSINLVTGNEYTGISFKFPPASVAGKWYHLQFSFDKDRTTLRINGQLVGTAATPVALGQQVRMVFGANHYKHSNTYDLPTMRLRDVGIAMAGKPQYHWALHRFEGKTDQDIISHKTAMIENPVWLAQAYSEWAMREDVMVNGNASVAFDKQSGKLYITGSDTIYQFSCKGNQLDAIPLAENRALPAGNVSEYAAGKLLNYFPDDQQLDVYDGAHRSWSSQTTADKVTGYWQHNHYYASFDSSLYLFGGYGHYHYSNAVQRYNTASNKWETVPATGDHFAPRYMAALGTSANGDTAYILGGHGSVTGDQMLNPENFYDLMLFDARNHTFKKVYTLEKPEEPMAFGNSMVVDTREQSYYALTYANDRMESSLQLIKGSLQKPTYIKLGNAIPYQFYDIKSTVALYYCPQAQELVAVTMYTSDHHTTHVKIHTILFPPALLMVQDHSTPDYSYLLWGLGILTALFILLSLRKQPRISVLVPPQAPKALPAFRVIELPAPPIVEEKKAAVLLFGHFTVIDKEQNDITRLFSPLVKELFLLILLHSCCGKKGISSEKINEILWTGRSVKDAKNNRSVNMVKLKNILEKLGNYTLAKENGKWLLTFDETVFVDIRHSQQDIAALIQVSTRGGLLMETEYSWLDKFKSDLGTATISVLGTHLEEHAEQLHPEQIIRVCDSMLHFDSLCEEAILYKCRALVALHQHATARSLFRSFSMEYEEIYGEPFEKDYMAVMVN